jgi:hypothetical protein
MGTGYVRNDTSNNIADGNIINAADLDGEFDAIESAFGTSGHTHDGTSAEGGPITVLGPVQDFVASATEIKPKTTNTLDIGTSGLLFKDMYLDGVATLGSIKIDNDGTIGSASDADAITISSSGVVTFSQNTIGKTGSGYVLSLQTSDTTIEATNVLGKIEFSAPDEASGTDAILVGASIEALAEDTFDSSTNSTALVFKTNTTGAATERMRLTSAGDLHFLDSRKAIFGAGSDLQIYHDGSNSYVQDAGDGSLILNTTNGGGVYVYSAGETMATFNSNGAVNLYYDNAAKLATTSTGVNITGTKLDITGSGNTDIYLNTGNNLGDNNRIFFGDTADIDTGYLSYDHGTNSMTFGVNGTVERMRIDSSGNVGIGTDSPYSFGVNAKTLSLNGVKGGAVAFTRGTNSATKQWALRTSDDDALRFEYGPTLASEAMRIDSSGNVGIGTSSPSMGVDIVAANNSQLRIDSSDANDTTFFLDYNGGGATNRIRVRNAAGDLAFNVSNTTEAMRIDSSGNVGIGTTSPSELLSLEGVVGANADSPYLALSAGRPTDRYSAIGLNRGGTSNQVGLSFYTTNNLDTPTEKMRIDSSGNVGIGTVNPAHALQVSTTSGNAYMRVERANQTTGQVGVQIGGGTSSTDWFTYMPASSDDLAFFGNSSERMRIDSSGNVGIGVVPETWGTYTPLQVQQASLASYTNGDARLTNNAYYSGGWKYIDSRYATQYLMDASNGVHTWSVVASGTADAAITWSEAMRIDSSGNVGIGTDSPLVPLHVSTSGTSTASGGNAAVTIRSEASGRSSTLQFSDGTVSTWIGQVSGSNINFGTNNAEAMRITSSGNVGIGTTSPTRELSLEKSTDNAIMSITSGTSNLAGLVFGDTADDDRGYVIYSNSGEYLYFGANGSERMRIESSGNLLVGKTTNNSATTGHGLTSAGFAYHTRSGGEPLYLNRLSSDGSILTLAKDGAPVGSIGTASSYLFIGGSSNGKGIKLIGNAVQPSTSTGADNDNDQDLGGSSARWDDIYAANGTIQTSDQNEKQQIASLTDAEITAAKAISKLFKTFKWNDSVAEKGDAARTHTGVIAQEVEQAMTDAGLNAGDYAFFISSDWTDEDTGEERNRKGIRYPQLMSFIGAATEQRLASIEARLDALEGV